MAILNKTKEILPFIPGYVVYMMGGKMIVRAKGSVDKKRRKEQPVHAGVRRHYALCGQAAVFNKCIRRELAPLIGSFGSASFCAALQKSCYAMFRNYSDRRNSDTLSGKRSIAPFILRE